jgi:hypothetical protein
MPRTAALVVALFAGLACAQRPWKVDVGQERRFGEARKACELLTDDTARFEDCMRHRGWRREYPGGW